MKKNIDSQRQAEFLEAFFAACSDFNLDPNLMMDYCIKYKGSFDMMINVLLENTNLKSLWLRFGLETPDFIQEQGQLHFVYVLGKRLSSLDLKEILEKTGWFEHNIYPDSFDTLSVAKKRRNIEKRAGIRTRKRYLFFVQTSKGICVRSYFYAFGEWKCTEEYLDNVQGCWTNGSLLFLRQTIKT